MAVSLQPGSVVRLSSAHAEENFEVEGKTLDALRKLYQTQKANLESSVSAQPDTGLRLNGRTYRSDGAVAEVRMARWACAGGGGARSILTERPNSVPARFDRTVPGGERRSDEMPSPAAPAWFGSARSGTGSVSQGGTRGDRREPLRRGRHFRGRPYLVPP
jgi:hypothetical protein